ncbi:hypothetical protein LPJ66_010319 [Kickxella alabastrina]|uniref:Uncharacterized protein n=1 Tax=Kickxella alabastrina TaxID=61397 RepID=A0ACC1I1I9_9FUNG|nr:hypothetical protein LPJ66_010319 [Kickxella alabastrina]
MSSPMLSLGTAASTPTDHGMPTQRYQMISQKMMSLSHVSNSSNNTTSTPRSQLRKSILNPQFSPVSPSTGVRQEQHQHQNQRAPLLMLQSSRLCSSPKSPLRPVSVHQHSLVSATPSAQLPMRPLLSQRPPVPRESCVDLLTQAHHLSTPIPIQQQQHQQPIQSQVSTKRARRDGVAVAELRVAVSHTLSEYRLWWHCLNDNSHAMIHIHRPPASLRIHVYAAQAVMAPHLFSASGEVAELLAHDASASASALAAGQPLTVLLSLAVCAASVPRVAKQIADRLTMLETAETTEPLTVKIYQPWRMQGQGQGAHVSILTSRFHIE